MDDTKEVPGTVGARLREAREARGQSIEEIGRQTRVPVRHLGQIESGVLEGLPAAPYSAGFVKAYARAVGLDPTALSQEFRAEFDQAQRGAPRIAYEPYEPADPSRLPPRLLAVVALAIAILLVGGYAIWRSGVLTGEGPESRAQLAAGTSDTPPAPAAAPARRSPPAAAPVAASGPVVLTARDPVWVSISERAGGGKIFLGVIEKGQSYTVPPTAVDPVIRLGKAEALDVTVGGRPVPPLGPPAKTIADVSLKPDALLARSNGNPPPQSEAPPPATSAVAPPAAGTPPAFRTAGQ